MNRLTNCLIKFDSINPTYYFTEIRNGLDWYMACHRDEHTIVLHFHEWDIEEALRTVGNWAYDHGLPWFTWQAATAMSTRLRWHRSCLPDTFRESGHDVEFLKAIARCGCEVAGELSCAMRRWELLRECVRDVECGR